MLTAGGSGQCSADTERICAFSMQLSAAGQRTIPKADLHKMDLHFRKLIRHKQGGHSSGSIATRSHVCLRQHLHIAARPAHQWVKRILAWNLGGARARGGPRHTWESKLAGCTHLWCRSFCSTVSVDGAGALSPLVSRIFPSAWGGLGPRPGASFLRCLRYLGPTSKLASAPPGACKRFARSCRWPEISFDQLFCPLVCPACAFRPPSFAQSLWAGFSRYQQFFLLAPPDAQHLLDAQLENSEL